MNFYYKKQIKTFVRQQYPTRIMQYFNCFHHPETILKHEKFREGKIYLFVFGGRKKNSFKITGFLVTTGEASRIETVGLLTCIITTKYYLIWLLPDTFQEKTMYDLEHFCQLRWLILHVNTSDKRKGRHIYQGKVSCYQEQRVLNNFL